MAAGTLTHRLTVKRYHPEKSPSYYESTHSLNFNDKRPTVLQALISIYENMDPTLAFSYNCRYKKCGLCAVEVDGHPALACVTPLQEQQTIGPLSNLPLHKDLVVNRTLLETLLRRERIFRVPEIQKTRTETAGSDFYEVRLHPHQEILLSCIECLCCHANCPVLKDGSSTPYAGPFVFVKLAQLYLDPLDSLDRASQAAQLGIDACSACRQCTCPQGIDIYNQAILPLMGKEHPGKNI